MCRLLTYVGPRERLDKLLLAPPHSLVVQSYRPREMREALLNADGFGVAWYGDEEETPALYRTPMPLWSDENLPRMAMHLRSSCVLASVRSATPGLPVSLANTQPFVHGRLSFAHNGYVDGFRSVRRALCRTLSDTVFETIAGTTDSEIVFAYVLDALLADPSSPLQEAVLRGIARLEGVLSDESARALLNVVISDGRSAVAVRHARNDDAPTLYLLDRRGRNEGVLIASEPIDADPGWRALEFGEVVFASIAGELRSARLAGPS